jgi:hypothetical protein
MWLAEVANVAGRSCYYGWLRLVCGWLKLILWLAEADSMVG